MSPGYLLPAGPKPRERQRDPEELEPNEIHSLYLRELHADFLELELP